MWAYKTKMSVCVKMWLKSTYSKLSVSRWGTSSLHVDMYLSRVINIILAVDSQTSVLLKCYMAYYWQQTVHVLLWLTHLLLSALHWLDFLLPWLRTKFSERSFSHASPSAWNDLPEDLHAVAERSSDSSWRLTFLLQLLMFSDFWLSVLNVLSDSRNASMFRL